MMQRNGLHLFSTYLLILLGFAFFCMSQPAFAAPQPIGQVVWVNGDVQAIQPDKSKRTLQRRSVIFEQDTIVTSEKGSGEIVFTDSSVLALRGGTELKIDKYKYDPKTPGDSAYVASLAKGGFRTITGLISKGHPDNYRVNTPVATIGVRGTIFAAAYTMGSGLALAIEQGAILATNQAGSYELNHATTMHYAQISASNQQATRTTVKPAVLATVPPVTPAAAPTASSLQQQVNTQGGAAQPSSTTAPPPSDSGTGGTGGTTGGTTSTDTSGGTGTTTSTGETPISGGDTGGTTSSTEVTPTPAAPAPSTGGTTTEFCIGG